MTDSNPQEIEISQLKDLISDLLEQRVKQGQGTLAGEASQQLKSVKSIIPSIYNYDIPYKDDNDYLTLVHKLDKFGNKKRIFEVKADDKRANIKVIAAVEGPETWEYSLEEKWINELDGCMIRSPSIVICDGIKTNPPKAIFAFLTADASKDIRSLVKSLFDLEDDKFRILTKRLEINSSIVSEHVSSHSEVAVHAEEDQIETAAPEDYRNLRNQFGRIVRDKRIVLGNSSTTHEQRCTAVLASFLSSQLLFLAGRSGTGKSSIAKILGSLAMERMNYKIAELDARMGWLGPEEVGGFRGLGNASEWIPGPLTDSLAAGFNYLRVEESNLSKMEGYLSPLIHGLSDNEVRWVSWSPRPEKTRDDQTTYPALGPFPRVVCTLNIDENSEVPSRKVLARAGTVFLPNCNNFFGEQHSYSPSESMQALPTSGPRLFPVKRTDLSKGILDTIRQAVVGASSSWSERFKEAVSNVLTKRTEEKVLIHILNSYLLLGIDLTNETLMTEKTEELFLDAIAIYLLPLLDNEDILDIVIGESPGKSAVLNDLRSHYINSARSIWECQS